MKSGNICWPQQIHLSKLGILGQLCQRWNDTQALPTSSNEVKGMWRDGENFLFYKFFSMLETETIIREILYKNHLICMLLLEPPRTSRYSLLQYYLDEYTIEKTCRHQEKYITRKTARNFVNAKAFEFILRAICCITQLKSYGSQSLRHYRILCK